MSLFFRNLLHALLLPGTVALLIPWLIARDEFAQVIVSAQWYQWFGILFFTFGAAVLIRCIAAFAQKGRGTLSPIDPTRELVVSGMYKYTRNPMYVGVLLMLIGWAIAVTMAELWWYTLLVFVVFNAFIHFVEEPRLRRDFGTSYLEYCKKVRRWF